MKPLTLLTLHLPMTNIIVWLSPKTAGASSVSFNAALLQKSLNPSERIVFTEFSPYSSQSVLFEGADHWGLLPPFLNTSEWNQALLHRTNKAFSVPVWWSPTGKNFPTFDLAFAEAYYQLLTESFDTVHIDLSMRSGDGWQEFWHKKANKIMGVVTPDPLSLSAWQAWQQVQPTDRNISWVLNQVHPTEFKNLTASFADDTPKLRGILRQELASFWQQTYAGVPVCWQQKSKFKKDLYTTLQHLKLVL